MNRVQTAFAFHQIANAGDAAAATRLLEATPGLLSQTTDDMLTQIIGEQYARSVMRQVTLFLAVRGFLRRCRRSGVTKTVDEQRGWPLSAHRPLARLMFPELSTPTAERLAWANLALEEIDESVEAELFGLAHYLTGLIYHEAVENGELDAFAPAIRHLETAVTTLATAHSDAGRSLLGRAQHNLGGLYLGHQAGERRHSVEEAIKWLELASAAFESSSIREKVAEEYVDTLTLQGNAYLERIQGEHLHNIEQAIVRLKKGHHLAEKDGQQRQLVQIEHNLAVAYRQRLAGRSSDNYERALDWAQQALDRIDPGGTPEAWAKTTAELAAIFAHRMQGDQADNLDKAIDYAKHAGDVYQAAGRRHEWSLTQLHLGNLYCDRIRGDKQTNLRRAIDLFQSILEIRDRDEQPIGWAEVKNNLGTAHAQLSQSRGDLHYQQAMSCFEDAMAIHGPEKLPIQARRTAVNQGNLAFRYGEWKASLTALQQALTAGEALYQASGTEAGRHAELAENAGVATKAAFCWLKLKEPDRAFRQLERGKARLLSEALALRGVDLSRASPEQQEMIRELRQQIRQLESEMRRPVDAAGRRSDLELGSALVNARSELKTLFDEIPETQAQFVQPEGPVQISDLPIPAETTLVAPLITEQGCAVFVLPHDDVMLGEEHVIWLPGFTTAKLAGLLLGDKEDPGWVPAYLQRARGGPEVWRTRIDHFTNWLWREFVEELESRLRHLKAKRILFIPQSGLQLLPIHAAWREVESRKVYLMDDYEVSYAPSLSVIGLSGDLPGNAPTKDSLVAGVGNYQALSQLPFATLEAREIAGRLGVSPLIDEVATRERIMGGASGKMYLHFACHGSFDWQDNPLNSAITLAHDEPLSLADVLGNLRLEETRLVTLSACETGVSDVREIPDEFIGLPAGFMQAGALAVISSLWTVNDLSTALLMDRFFELHIGDGRRPAEALRLAQIWLREASGGELAERIRNMRFALEEEQRQEKSGLNYLSFTRRRFIEDEEDRPYAHPYYWAAFTVNGH